MLSNGIVLNNTSIIGAFVTTPVSLPHGMQGVVVAQNGAGFDPALTVMTVNLRLGGAAGSGYIVVHSSKVITTACVLQPVYFPAGEYTVNTLGGSSVVASFVGIYPTP